MIRTLDNGPLRGSGSEAETAPAARMRVEIRPAATSNQRPGMDARELCDRAGRRSPVGRRAWRIGLSRQVRAARVQDCCWDTGYLNGILNEKIR